MGKLLASDFDDTLYRDLKVSESDVEAINRFRAAGNLFGIATGRSVSMILEPLKKNSIPFDFLVCNNGGIILDRDQKVIYQKDIPIEVVDDLITFLKSKDLRFVGISDGDSFGAFLKDGEKYHHPDESLKDLKYLEPEKILAKGHVNSILANGKTHKETERLAKEVESRYSNEVSCFINNICTLDINAKDTNKKSAIDIIGKHFGVDECYVIGDGQNDYEMIKAYNGFAVENAIDDVKRVAKYVVSSLEECIKKIM